ncbi:MAG: hypothetical protein NVSMB38_11370 [Ktedonobacteraceae bacterium]
MSENKGYVHPGVLVDADWVMAHLKDPKVRLIEVDVDTNAYEQGHIPGAASIPWATAVRPDGTFKSAEELRSIYEGKGVTPDKEVIAYCRIGERSSHTWFALNYLLGYPNVRNYDGSWTEWGSLIGVPIER